MATNVYKNVTWPDWTIPLNVDSTSGGSSPDDITNIPIANFYMDISNTSTGQEIRAKGVIALKTASPAVIYFTPDPADVANTGTFNFFVKAIIPNTNGRIVTWDPEQVTIVAS